MFLLSPRQALQSVRYCIDFQLISCIFPMACPFSNEQWKKYEEISFDCCSKILNQTESLFVSQSPLLLSAFFTPLYHSYTYSNGAIHNFPFTKEHMKETWKVSKILHFRFLIPTEAIFSSGNLNDTLVLFNFIFTLLTLNKVSGENSRRSFRHHECSCRD